MKHNDRFKFRCWDNESGEYIDFGWNPDYGLELDFTTGKLMWQSVPDGEDEYPKELDTKQLVIEQCTGLKDKNGNLIYEGDIVRSVLNTGYIKWHSRDLTYYLSDLKRSSMVGLNTWQDGELEIIGNVHEQKE